MRAVNLLPVDQRRGSAAPGRSGAGVYVLLGVLAALVVAAGAYVMATNQVNANRTQLAEAEQEATSLEQQASAYKPYVDFAKLSQARVATVAELARSRFDWERVLRELARAMPGDVWLTSLVGTVAPGVSVDGSSGSGTGTLRGSMQLPAVEMVGCTESHSGVSRVMARLRMINGVERVTLAASEKSESASASAPTAGGGGGSSDCRYGSRRYPQFQLIVFFEAPKTSLGATPAPGQAAAPATTTPASTGDAK